MEQKTFEHVFAKFIQKFHEQIKEAYLDDAYSARGLFSQHALGREMLQEIADQVLGDFTTMIDKKTSVELIADQYVRWGLRCQDDEVSYTEIVRALILLKRHIWVFFQDSNFAGQPYDVRSIVALNNRMALLFDRAIYHFLLGYEQASEDESSGLEELYSAFLNKVRHDLKLG